MSAVEFGSLFEFIRNGMNVKQDKSGNGLPITRIETISDMVVDGNKVGFAGLDLSDCEKWLLRPGDILFSHINSVDHIGKCAVYRGEPEKLVHGMNLLCLRCLPEKLYPEFAKYLIRGGLFRSRLTNFINKAVNQASVSIGNLKTILVDVPPLSEQKRIAEILDRAEALRSQRRAALALLDELTQSIFLDMFGDVEDDQRTVGQLLEENTLLLHKDGNHGSLYPRAEEFGEDGVPFVSAKSIDNAGQLDTSSVEMLCFDKANKLRIGWIKEGDVLLAHNASVGKVALYNGEFERALIGTSLTSYRPNQSVLNPCYLAACLRAPAFQRQLTQNMGQTTRNQVPITAQRRLKIHVPQIELQRKFAEKVAVLDRHKRKVCGSVDSLDELLTSLQHRAFRGEL